jgi:hypothetical protein
MLLKTVAYVITLLVTVVLEYLFPLMLLTMSLPLRRWKWIAIPATFTGGIVQGVVTVLLAAWIVRTIGASLSWLMFLIPFCLVIRGQLQRIRRVYRGVSGVKLMMERSGQLDSYDKRHDLLTAYASAVGLWSGWVVGMNLCLQSSGLL